MRSSPHPDETRNLPFTVPPNHSWQSSKPTLACVWSQTVPAPTPFIVMMFSSLSGVSSRPENSTRRYSTWPLLSPGLVPPKGTPWRPSARHSPLGQLTGAAPLMVRPPQSPGAPLLASTWGELVIRMGCAGLATALILEPRRKISAETFVGPPLPGLGGLLPTTSAPGSIVIVTPLPTKTSPSMSTRQPAIQCSFAVMVPVFVVRVVQLSPPAPVPALAVHGVVPTPVHRLKSVGLLFRLAWRTTVSSTPRPGLDGLTSPQDALPVPPQSAGFGTKRARWRRTASAMVRAPSLLRSPQPAAAAMRAGPATAASTAAPRRAPFHLSPHVIIGFSFSKWAVD